MKAAYIATLASIFGWRMARPITVKASMSIMKSQRSTGNTVEGYFSIFKRGMKGIYQHCGEQHLHRYLAEYEFRYNNREALGCNDSDRATRCASRCGWQALDLWGACGALNSEISPLTFIGR